MKKLALNFGIVVVLACAIYAGPEQFSGKDKEVVQPAPPPCDWYRAHEWDLSIWGAYAFPADTGHHETLDDSSTLPVEISDAGNPNDVNQLINTGPASRDRLLNGDEAGGGGVDIKYFWSRYFGIGLEGFALGSHNPVAAGLATLTLRYPIGCSRFAPYIFGGGGVVGGGSHTDHFFHERGDENEPLEIFTDNRVNNNDISAIGQFGGGLEIRVTRHIGVMSDFTWNFVGNDDSDFGMVRGGLTFGF
ncbi:MAG: hypothetical protein ABI925_03325 [Verrucomicrobiota bacterium]